MVNGLVGWKVLAWLLEQEEDVAVVVLHPPDRRRHGDEILSLLGSGSTLVLEAADLERPEVIERLAALDLDLCLSCFYGYILKPGFLKGVGAPVLNVHPALLPWNRGAYPNVWSILDGTPAGATIHMIDEGVDTGAIVAQTEVEVEPIDTGGSLYRKLEAACFDLVVATWPAIRAGDIRPVPQDPSSGTSHRRRDVEAIDEIDLDRSYEAGELIDILRARTFDGYPGAFFIRDGRKVWIEVSLSYDPSEGQSR